MKKQVYTSKKQHYENNILFSIRHVCPQVHIVVISSRNEIPASIEKGKGESLHS